MRLTDCHNFADFRRLASKRLPGPIFHYIDGAADDEVTYRRNTEAYEQVDLVPNVLNGVDSVDMSVEVMGQSWQCPSTVRRPRCSDCFTMRGSEPLRKAPRSLAPCLASHPWPQSRLRKLPSSRRAPKCSSSTSIKIEA